MMMRQPILSPAIERSCEAAGLAGKQALMAAGFDADEACLLGYYPRVARNPFQDMLYASAFDAGFACFPVADVKEMIKPLAGLKTFMHYHWVHRVFSACETSREAAKAANEFLRHVDQQRAAGMKIVWSLHNLLSHDARFPFEETALRAGLAARSDAIHIMNPATRELAAKYYEMDGSKVFAVPHPSYLGVYGDYIAPAQARLNLGIAPEEKVALLFGSLGPQKGTRQFLKELPAVEADIGHSLTVVIAGAPSAGAYMEDIYALIAGNPNIHLLEGHISDQLVQTVFRASNVVLCPYDTGLNSGVAATAASFGRPCVIPDIMAPAMAGAEAGVIGFNIKNRASLGAAVRSALEASTNPDVEAHLAVWAERNRPRLVSKAFFNELKARLND